MNVRAAQQDGLHFTGIYSFDKEEVKERIRQEKIDCPRARILLVFEPSDKLSRGSHSGGWSAYADKVYSAYQAKREAEYVLSQHETNMAYYKAEYDKHAKELDDKFQAATKRILEANEILGIVNPDNLIKVPDPV